MLHRAAALAWEAAFVGLARDTLSTMAESRGLSMSFSTERSVQDELERESYADASTVSSHTSPLPAFRQSISLTVKCKQGFKRILTLLCYRCAWPDCAHRQPYGHLVSFLLVLLQCFDYEPDLFSHC